MAGDKLEKVSTEKPKNTKNPEDLSSQERQKSAEKIDPVKAFQLTMQGKTFDKNNPKGNAEIPGENGPISVGFDMKTNKFTIGGKEYQAKLPMGAEIEKVSFEQDGIKITGSLLFASQEKTVSYKDFSTAFNKLNSSNGTETKVNLGGSEVTFLAQDAPTKKPQQKVELAEAN